MTSKFAAQLLSLARPEPEPEPDESLDGQLAAPLADEEHVLGEQLADVGAGEQLGQGRAPRLRVANQRLLEEIDGRYAVEKTDRKTHFGDQPPSPTPAEMDTSPQSDGSDSEDSEHIEDVEMEQNAHRSVAMDVPLLANSVADETRNKKRSAILAQRQLWEQLLGARIKLQPIIQISNRLPAPGENWNAITSQADADTRQLLAKCQGELSSALKKCNQLEDAIIDRNSSMKKALKVVKKSNSSGGSELSDGSDSDASVRGGMGEMSVANDQNPPDHSDDDQSDDVIQLSQSDESGSEIDSDGGTTSGKSPEKCGKKRSNLELELRERHKRVITYRNDTLRKWHEKLRGTTSAGSKDFSQFNTDIVKQIDNVLSDRERLLKRITTRRSDYSRIKPINAPETAENGNTSVFDDDDFYEQLLNELIESKSSGFAADDNGAMTRQWLELQRLRRKRQKKRLVDTKASKGRKVRYDVMQKLMNYMAPRPADLWTDGAKDELFRSLFA